MSHAFALNAQRIAQALPQAEADIDTALVSIAHLMATLVQARIETDVPASTGQKTLIRLARAQMSLMEVSNEVLRTHSEVLTVGKEVAVGDVHECPKKSFGSTGALPLKAVA